MMKDGLTFVTENHWREMRPHILVVACSDGRYQEALDEFLRESLSITHYDRLYAPGGPGALSTHIDSILRGTQHQNEASFLIDAHELEEIILVFHGAALPEGPTIATCADYMRKMPEATPSEIANQQVFDIVELQEFLHQQNASLRLRVYRAEVREDHTVQFTTLLIS